MIDSDMQPCWRGNIDISQLTETFDEEAENALAKFGGPKGLLEGKGSSTCICVNPKDVYFIPTNPRDLAPPFAPDMIPTAVAVVDLTEVPLWMFADSTWNLYRPIALLLTVDKPLARRQINSSSAFSKGRLTSQIARCTSILFSSQLQSQTS